MLDIKVPETPKILTPFLIFEAIKSPPPQTVTEEPLTSLHESPTLLISTHPEEDGQLVFTETTKLLPVILGPNITGNLYLVTGSNDCTGSFYFTSSTNSRISASVVANANNDIGFSASKSTSIYGNSTTVQPSSLVLNYVIKY